MDKKCKRKNTALPLLLAALTLAGAGLWWGNYTLSTEEYTFTSRRLPEGWDGARIVVLSDLHGRRFGRDNSRLLEAVRKARPDIIALVGDLVDEWSGTEYLRPLLRGLTAMAPTYFVSGNHEWAAGKMQETAALLADCGVTYLSNTFVTLERNGGAIAMAGIDDPNGFADQKTPQEVARDVRDAIGNGFWLLLAHRNTHFETDYAALGADLTLSGHGHGGLWRLPFTDGLLGNGGALLPSYTNGFYTCRGADVFVSRGLGGMVRLFNRPEVAVLTLRRA